MLHQSQFIEMFGNPNKNERNFDSYQAYELFDLQMGKTPDRSIQDYWTDGTFIWVSIGDMQEGMKYITDSKECITDIAVSKSGIKIVPKGTLLMSFKLTIGRVVFAHEDLYTNEAIMAFIDKKQVELSDQWLYQLLLQYNWLANASQAVKGKTLNKETIGNSVLFIPPMELQKNFASIVEQADKSKFDGFKSQFIEMFGCDPIGDCKWPTKTFGELFDISSSRRILKDDWAQEGVPFLRVRDLIHYSQTGELRNEFFVSDSFYNKLKDTDGKVQAGDILVSATSTIGKCMIVQNGEKYYYKDADVLRFREKEPVNKVFFIYGITMPTVENQINDTIGKTTVGHFLISKAATIKQPLPPIALQETFERVVNQADKSKYMD